MADYSQAAVTLPSEPWPNFIRDNMGMYIGGNTEIALYCVLKSLIKEAMQDAAHPATRFEITLHDDGAYSLSNNADLSQLDIDDTHTVSQLGRAIVGKSWSYLPIAGALASRFQRTLATGRMVYREDVVAPSWHSVWTMEDDNRPAGQTIRFLPDPILWIRGDVPWHEFWKDMRELAALSPQHTFRFVNEQVGVETTFSYRQGLKSYLVELVPHYGHEPLYIRSAVGEYEVEVALHWPQYTSPFLYKATPFLRSFVNGERTRCGTHVDGLWQGLIDGLASYIEQAGLGELRDFKLKRKAIKKYICGAISVRVPHPLWAGATRAELVNPEAATIVADVIRAHILSILESTDAAQHTNLSLLLNVLKRDGKT
jgi:DNA gyrase/topoisomerase IV subunit B